MHNIRIYTYTYIIIYKMYLLMDVVYVEIYGFMIQHH